MMNVVQKVRVLWNKEQIRVLVMSSLAMQVILIACASLRKRSGSKVLLLLLWSVYLAADYVATLALAGILAHTMDTTLDGHSDVNKTEQILIAFWSPFLLLHLGGPDNITSYSMEDNELWWRHLFSFVAQVSVTLMVFVLSSLQSTKLLVPSILMLFVGTVKFGERTLALREGTMEQIRYKIVKKQLDTEGRALLCSDGDNSEADFIRRGYNSFFSFTAHIVSVIDKHKQWWRGHERVFEQIGMELSFFYDILHTKASFVHCFAGRMIRLASLISIAIALIFFHISEKWDHDSSDVTITYILLSMALLLEIYSIFLLVASIWTTISLLRLETEWSRNLAKFMSRAKNHAFCRGNKRWCLGHMGQYSLLQSCVRKVYGIHMILDPFKNASDFWFGDKHSAEVLDILEKRIIQHVDNLAAKSTNHSNLAMELRSTWITKTLDRYNLNEIKSQIERKPFDSCVIAWHMATEMCYLASKYTNNRDTKQCGMREAMYMLSNYMMHLLRERSSMMPPGIAMERTESTIKDINSSILPTDSKPDVRGIFEFLIMEPKELESQGHKEPVQLFWQIWKDLRKIGEEFSVERQWEIISEAWMEMLTFAALRCRPMEHVKGLSRGGELLTYHWLLLAHYNIDDESVPVTEEEAV